jgi:hypothetical protein
MVLKSRGWTINMQVNIQNRYSLRLKLCIVCSNMYYGYEKSRFCSRKCWVLYENMPNGSIFKCLLCNTVFKTVLMKDENRHTHFNYKKKCPRCGAKGNDYIVKRERQLSK